MPVSDMSTQSGMLMKSISICTQNCRCVAPHAVQDSLLLGGIDGGSVCWDLAMSFSLLNGVSCQLVSNGLLCVIILVLGILLCLFHLVTSLIVCVLQMLYLQLIL